MGSGSINILIAVTIVTAVAGCSDSNDSTKLESKKYTVSELMGNETLLEELRTRCNDNPGELRETANCINAYEAARKLKYSKMAEKYSQ